MFSKTTVEARTITSLSSSLWLQQGCLSLLETARDWFSLIEQPCSMFVWLFQLFILFYKLCHILIITNMNWTTIYTITFIITLPITFNKNLTNYCSNDDWEMLQHHWLAHFKICLKQYRTRWKLTREHV